jgi:hypothetical protein
MKIFRLNEQDVEIDETLTYAEFFVNDGKPNFFKFDLIKLLTEMEAGNIEFKNAKKELKLLSRWVKEAPRKRFFRKEKQDGMPVLSTEYFFEDIDEGEEMINMLENSGRAAVKILAAYGEGPMGEIENTGPDPVSGEELEGLLE